VSLGSTPTVPKVAAIALMMVGLGLIGMTASDLPGIAEQLEAPRWLMGVLGGILIGRGGKPIDQRDWLACCGAFQHGLIWFPLASWELYWPSSVTTPVCLRDLP